MTIRLVRAPIFAAAFIFASSCGAPAPSANAGAAASVATGGTAQLDGSKSSAVDGAALSFAWSFQKLPAGSRAELNDAGIVNPSFRTDVAGEYVAALIVSANGIDSPPATVTVTADPCGAQPPVIASISSSGGTSVGALVQLTADVSDADNDPPCSLAQQRASSWALTSIPAGSAAALNDARVDAPSFVADVAGSYEVQLIATDSGGQSAVAVSTVTIDACGTAAPTIGAVTPSNATPNVGEAVILGVTAADGDDACLGAPQPLRFLWRVLEVPNGSTAALNDASLQAPSFIPDVGPGAYSFEVQVIDATDRSASAVVVVNAAACGGRAPVADIALVAPIAASGGSATVGVGAVVQASSGATADPDIACRPDDPLSYRWELLAAPAGSQATLSQAAAERPWFRADIGGDYTLRLIATDGVHASVPATFIVTAN